MFFSFLISNLLLDQWDNNATDIENIITAGGSQLITYNCYYNK